MKEFLENTYPDWRKKMISPGFEIDVHKKGIEGFPEEARAMVNRRKELDAMLPLEETDQERSEWKQFKEFMEAAKAGLAEYKMIFREGFFISQSMNFYVDRQI